MGLPITLTVHTQIRTIMFMIEAGVNCNNVRSRNVMIG